MKIVACQNKIVFENALSGEQNKPYYQGLGHGQYLIKRIVEQMSWSVTTEQQKDSYKVEIQV